MARDPRLRDDRTDALKQRAEPADTGMHAMVPRAVDDHPARTAEEALVRKTARAPATRWRELMERLE
ncbi:CopG family transcriptional regulator [Streptomyces sp. DH12]|uniref:CopG family transcriptional regulator n=1 Tax=Streptomyces sp. DH12 TaxID=2857010 RepID=UPI001E316443|nr:CopG family transcriptional regulator [Streptomyces sp. DH12]